MLKETANWACDVLAGLTPMHNKCSTVFDWPESWLACDTL